MWAQYSGLPRKIQAAIGGNAAWGSQWQSPRLQCPNPSTSGTSGYFGTSGLNHRPAPKPLRRCPLLSSGTPSRQRSGLACHLLDAATCGPQPIWRNQNIAHHLAPTATKSGFLQKKPQPGQLR